MDRKDSPQPHPIAALLESALIGLTSIGQQMKQDASEHIAKRDIVHLFDDGYDKVMVAAASEKLFRAVRLVIARKAGLDVSTNDIYEAAQEAYDAATQHEEPQSGNWTLPESYADSYCLRHLHGRLFALCPKFDHLEELLGVRGEDDVPVCPHLDKLTPAELRAAAEWKESLDAE